MAIRLPSSRASLHFLTPRSSKFRAIDHWARCRRIWHTASCGNGAGSGYCPERHDSIGRDQCAVPSARADAVDSPRRWSFCARAERPPAEGSVRSLQRRPIPASGSSSKDRGPIRYSACVVLARTSRSCRAAARSRRRPSPIRSSGTVPFPMHGPSWHREVVSHLAPAGCSRLARPCLPAITRTCAPFRCDRRRSC